jgi:hypothetical protein
MRLASRFLLKGGGAGVAATPTCYRFIRASASNDLTVAYTSAEGLVFIVASLIAGSAFLVGLGLDSVIEVASHVGVTVPAASTRTDP